MDVSCRKAGRTVTWMQVGCLSSGAYMDDGCGGLATLRSGSWYGNRGVVVKLHGCKENRRLGATLSAVGETRSLQKRKCPFAYRVWHWDVFLLNPSAWLIMLVNPFFQINLWDGVAFSRPIGTRTSMGLPNRSSCAIILLADKRLSGYPVSLSGTGQY